MTFQFNLLLANDELTTARYYTINEPYLVHTLQLDLVLPVFNDKPFVFSCFALSVDGKVCYPDLTSGFHVAKCNHLASEAERFADWWTLSLARAISDAVIVGSNSILNEHGNYAAQLDIPELISLRNKLNKIDDLLHIVVVRDASKIDWYNEFMLTNPDIRLVIYCEQTPQNTLVNIKINHSYQVEDNKQIIQVAKLELATLINDLSANGIKTILNESPYYHHHLQELQLLDEAWLNTSGVYIGGGVASLGLNNQSFTAAHHPHYTLLSLHNLGFNFLYSRYKIVY